MLECLCTPKHVCKQRGSHSHMYNHRHRQENTTSGNYGVETFGMCFSSERMFGVITSHRKVRNHINWCWRTAWNNEDTALWANRTPFSTNTDTLLSPAVTYGFLFWECCPSHLCCDVINFLLSSLWNMMSSFSALSDDTIQGNVRSPHFFPIVTSITMTSRKPKYYPRQGCAQSGSAPPKHMDQENNVTAILI